MADCLSIADSTEYNCTTRWGLNCTNALGFDFTSLWNITQLIQQYCPTDPRLFLIDNIPATPENAALKYSACKTFAPALWTRYPISDIWARLQTWKFPLFQLALSSPRPPLGLLVDGFVLAHLMGDPISTIKDLRKKISRCEECATHFAEHLVLPNGDRLSRHAWKALAMITISYDEWGQGDEVQEALGEALNELTASGIHPGKFLRLCGNASDALAADRATAFLPIVAAQGFFVGALAVAVFKTTAITSTSSLFVNVEAHSIAFSALYFWIIPAVFLSAMIGVSQTEKNISRILENLQTALSHEPDLEDIHLPSVPTFNEKGDRIANGGIYSWQPESNPEGLWHWKVNFLPIFTVSSGTFTAMLVSRFVPADGWQPRHCAHATFFLIWFFSFLITNLFKQLGGKNFPRFGFTFAKDVIVTVGTLAALMYIQVGPFNDCSSYTLWGRKGLALPGMPEVEAILNSRMRSVYPAIAFTSIGIQLVLIPLVVFIWSPRAFRVLLQSDDGTSLWQKWLPFGRAGYDEIQSQGIPLQWPQQAGRPGHDFWPGWTRPAEGRQGSCTCQIRKLPARE